MVGWLAAVITVGGLTYLLVWYVPDTLARRHADASVESAWISAVAITLGVVATAAVAVAAFWYSRSTNQATIDAAKDSTDKTLDAAREAQFPDRYSKAIEQLGSDNMDVRLGGIYALEGIAVDSARHHPTVMEVLAAFIREHSREQWPVPGSDDAAVPERTTRPDVQAALTVIGRRDAARDRRRIDLHGADLIRANLTRANLTHANLTGAILSATNLADTELADARFSEAMPVPEGWVRDAGTGRLKRSDERQKGQPSAG